MIDLEPLGADGGPVLSPSAKAGVVKGVTPRLPVPHFYFVNSAAQAPNHDHPLVANLATIAGTFLRNPPLPNGPGRTT